MWGQTFNGEKAELNGQGQVTAATDWQRPVPVVQLLGCGFTFTNVDKSRLPSWSSYHHINYDWAYHRQKSSNCSSTVV